MANAQTQGSNRGFAAMDPQKQRQIASMGGKAAHAKGAAHEFTSAEAREAGRKGGLNSHGRKTANAAANTPATADSTVMAAPQMTQSTPQTSSSPRLQQTDGTPQRQG